jgi:protein SCO1/2
VRSAAALVVVGAVCLGACDSGGEAAPVAGISVRDDDGMHGAVLAEPYRLPDVTLTASDETAYSLARDTDAKLTLVFFGYTHCPDICQLVMADIASAMARLDESTRARVGMLFITSDPARDDPATLRRYLDRFDPGFEGLTGPLARIVGVGDAVGVAIEKGERLTSGGYAVAHGTQIVGVDARGRAPIVWTQGTSAAQLAEDITRLVDDPGRLA